MNYSVAVSTRVESLACGHLLREDRQEDLCFALWHPSRGHERFTGLITEVILPTSEDRLVHGNASFLPGYFELALAKARHEHSGLAFIHSHPGAGWQGMSPDDVEAENRLAPASWGSTQLPLLGLTVGSDRAWSARFWEHVGFRKYARRWCESVRVIGDRLEVTFNEEILPPPGLRPELQRTTSAWGRKKQADISRLRIGIIGAGSVGSIVAESLARMGISHIRLFDFDTLKQINLDRQLHATRADVLLGRSKVQVLADAIRRSGTASPFRVDGFGWSVAEEEGFRRALDCDVLFSCVDRPWARHVLNFIAYAHFIPVVDGGIHIETSGNGRGLRTADWRAHTAMPTRPCLECIGQYNTGDVSTERDGFWGEPTYIAGLSGDHVRNRNENVFAFSLAVGSLEVLQLLALIVSPPGVSNPGAQMYHFPISTLDRDDSPCKPTCLFPKLEGRGDDTGYVVTGEHKAAIAVREQRRIMRLTLPCRLWLALRENVRRLVSAQGDGVRNENIGDTSQGGRHPGTT